MRWLIVLLLIGFGLWTAGTSLTLVSPGELAAVVRRFGQILEERPAPGLYVGWPWGIERIDRVPISRVRNVQVGWVSTETEDDSLAPPGQFLTGDHNLVNVQAEVHYRVVEDQVDRYGLNADRIDTFLARVTETALAEWVGARPVDEILLRGKAFLPTWLRGTVQDRLEGYHLGIHIEQASITYLNPPNEVRAYFDEVGQAQTAIGTKINRAQEEARLKLFDAEAQKSRSQRLTAAYANSERSQALADAQNFTLRWRQYHQLREKDPNYLNVLWLDEMGQLFARMKETGRIDLLDHHLSGDGLNITQFPLMPRKK